MLGDIGYNVHFNLRLARSAEGRLQDKNSTAASILQAVCVPTPSMLRISSKRALPNVLRLWLNLPNTWLPISTARFAAYRCQ